MTSATAFCPEYDAIMVGVSSRPRPASFGTHRLAACALLFAPVCAALQLATGALLEGVKP